MPLAVAVVGASGFFGKTLADVLAMHEELWTVTPVTRATYADASSGQYDVVVNAAMPSKRFWAKQHPELDFVETVKKTSDLLTGWRFQRFIQISSVSARCERDTVYGRHKAAAEVLCERPDCFVVRLSNLFGPGMTKGAIVDISRGQPVFVSGDSRYAFTDVRFAAGFVAGLLERSDLAGVMEVGAKNTVSLRDIAAHVRKDIQFAGRTEVQEIQNPSPEFPDAREVFRFASTLS